jgi:malonyl-CoA O-methyltransferase
VTSPVVGLPERAAAGQRFERAAATFDGADAVHAEARKRLIERLGWFKLAPQWVLDVGTATGRASLELAQGFPDARVLGVDLSSAMIHRAQRRCAGLPAMTPIRADAERLPLAAATVDLVFANMVLPWCAPEALFGEAARVLRDGGLLLFATVGPDTLQEVRRAWSEVDDSIHVHGFIDMHDLGDLAARAGLAEPVMDVDRLQVTYRDVGSLVADLRACGAVNVAFGRRASLTGPGRWRAFHDRLMAFRMGGRLAITVELVFGQAWGAGSGSSMRRGGDVMVSVEELAGALRRGR